MHTPAKAVTYNVAASAGLMQQPTSHYYLAVYGAQIDANFWDQMFVVRAQHVERPRFEAAGFADQEFATFGMIGSKITKQKNHGLVAFLGGGKVNGYVEIDENEYPDMNMPRRSFEISGLVVALEYNVQWKAFYAGAAHQCFIGYADQAQLDAYVAWPYNFFLLNAGVNL